MTDRFQNQYRIPSARASWWDYGEDAAYFVTICTKYMECCFGNVENDRMKLSGPGIIADVLWLEIKHHAKNVDLGEYVVMPNHVHGIVILNGGMHSVLDIDEMPGLRADTPHVETLHSTSLHDLQPQPPQYQPPSTSVNIKNERMASISPKPNSLSVVIRSYKSAVTRHARRLGFDFCMAFPFP